MFSWYTSSDISRFAICRRPFTPYEAIKLCFGRIFHYYKNDYYYWGIRYNHRIIGVINVYPSKNNDKLFGVCIKVSSDYKGLGIASEALSAVLEYFKTQEVSEIVGFCDVENIASKRVMEKSGMKIHGSPETNFKIKYDTGEIAKTYCFKFLYKI